MWILGTGDGIRDQPNTMVKSTGTPWSSTRPSCGGPIPKCLRSVKAFIHPKLLGSGIPCLQPHGGCEEQLVESFPCTCVTVFLVRKPTELQLMSGWKTSSISKEPGRSTNMNAKNIWSSMRNRYIENLTISRSIMTINWVLENNGLASGTRPRCYVPWLFHTVYNNFVTLTVGRKNHRNLPMWPDYVSPRRNSGSHTEKEFFHLNQARD
jgi:hypothetical protein